MEKMTEYRDRFACAMKLAVIDEHAVAAALGISYQAVKKVLVGSTKMLKADNNSVAAKLMNVDPDWLATGEGPMRRDAAQWPFSKQLLARCREASRADVVKAENAARNVLDLEPLPRSETALAA